MPEEQLSGIIELDETFVGGKNKNRHTDKKVKNSQGRSFKDKTPVMGILQQQEYHIIERPHMIIKGKTVKERIITSPTKLFCKVVVDTKSETLQPIIRNVVAEGSTVISDEWYGYRGLANAYSHYVIDHAAKQYVSEDGFTTNTLEGSWSHLKRAVIGTYHKTSKKHLNKYVQEFVFRRNSCNLDTQTKLNAIITNMGVRLKYKSLVA